MKARESVCYYLPMVPLLIYVMLAPFICASNKYSAATAAVMGVYALAAEVFLMAICGWYMRRTKKL